MEFRTQNGTHIPISGLDDSQAITVAVNNGSSGEVGAQRWNLARVPTAGAFQINQCDSVIVRVNTGNTNREAGLFVQLNFTSLEGELLWEQWPKKLNIYMFNIMKIKLCLYISRLQKDG